MNESQEQGQDYAISFDFTGPAWTADVVKDLAADAVKQPATDLFKDQATDAGKGAVIK